MNENTEPIGHKHAVPNHFNLPRRINRLADLAYNLWWTWNPDAERLFRNIDRYTWENTNHNPVLFLRQVSRQHLNAALHNRRYLETYDRILRSFDEYMKSGNNTWYAKEYPEHANQPIAYFSTEFGLHQTMPIYAGGLGILSGDHIKEASDLGLPLVAVGFLYTQGYFVQHISEDGWQEARYTQLSFDNLPVIPVLDEDGEPILTSVKFAGREIFARLWHVRVGRVSLYLLDTNVSRNAEADRQLTARLYTSDLEMRVSQEIILGIGGLRALRILGYNPSVYHMNEGHSAFLVLERLRELVDAGHDQEAAREIIRKSTVFTTHTPVPAGHDEFPVWIIDKYFNEFWPKLNLNREAFLDLARHQQPWGEAFAMAILAFRFSEKANGVSELHGQVARKMWASLWPDVEVQNVPITHITNGIHTGTWLARRLRVLYNRYLGPDWLFNLDDPVFWEAVQHIPDYELWAVHRHLKRKLLYYIQDRSRKLWLQGNTHPVQVIAGGVLLDPNVLTIGFARRFATYKRADLILSDMDRLLRLLNQPGKPVQIIFAGKAHPADDPGKRLIQDVYRLVKQHPNGGRLVFLEDYDMNLARYLLHGVDVWLNTPRRPNEASGTSGMKAALNGVLNFSILDGWWREGYNGFNGWVIGDDFSMENVEEQDRADAESLYQTLEESIVPAYYDRSSDGLPLEWLARMKNSIQTLAPRFSLRRMLKEYVTEMYHPVLPAHEHTEKER